MRRSKGRTDSPDVTGGCLNAVDTTDPAVAATDDSSSTSSKKHETENIKKQVTITVQPGVKPKPTVKKKRSTPSADLVGCSKMKELLRSGFV